MKYESKIKPELLVRKFLWEKYISHRDESSDFYILLSDAVTGEKKGSVSSSYPFSSIIHPSQYARMTWGEFYEWNELFVDKQCATCKHWDRSKTSEEKPYELPCLKDNQKHIFYEGEPCENYERRYTCLGKRDFEDEFTTWAKENQKEIKKIIKKVNKRNMLNKIKKLFNKNIKLCA